jgi:hypothetical protein
MTHTTEACANIKVDQQCGYKYTVTVTVTVTIGASRYTDAVAKLIYFLLPPGSDTRLEN